MKQFDFKRFAMVLWRELSGAWKILAAYAVICLLLLIYSNTSSRIFGSTLRENMFYTVTVAGAIVLASRLLSNIWTRRRCISTLSLPAAAAETFAARYLLWLVIPVWFAVSMLMVNEWLDLISLKELYNYRPIVDFWRAWGPTCLFVVVCTHAAMLGGAFFNRLSLVKTAAIFIVLFVAVVSVMTKYPHQVVLMPVLWTATVIMVVGGTALAFRRFNRRTVNQCRK
ncbi:MAG: hypothetical protein II671_08145 [Salinivirgaceae bacterium]|nr:hypothetical protein [Salinivirgaceae bacterium]